MLGNIVSWDNRKNFGFVKDDKGETYFLHNSEIKNKDSMKLFKTNSQLDFDFKATKRGLRAVDVKFIDNPKKTEPKERKKQNNKGNKHKKQDGDRQHKNRNQQKKQQKPKESFKRDVLNEGFVFRKRGLPRGKIGYTKTIQSMWSRDIESNKEELNSMVKDLGFNCLYNVEMKMEKRYSGNYIYKVFCFHGTAGVLFRTEPCSSKGEVTSSQTVKKHKEDEVKENVKHYLKNDNGHNYLSYGSSRSSGGGSSSSGGSNLPGVYGVISDVISFFR